MIGIGESGCGGSAEWRYGLEDKYGRNMGGTARTLDFTNGKIDVGEGIISTVRKLRLLTTE